MSPLSGRHASPPANRAGIDGAGLLPRRPVVDGNYQGDDTLADQPRGVYLTTRSWTSEEDGRWYDTEAIGAWPDVWDVAYVGRLAEDPLIGGAVVALDPVPREWVSLTREGAEA